MPSPKPARIVRVGVAVLAVTLTAGALMALAADEDVRAMRVFRVDGADTREVVTQFRTQLQILQIAELRDSATVVVSDTPAQVARAEALLREREWLAGAVTPHEPVPLEVPQGTAVETRTLAIADGQTRAAVLVLRAIYGMRDVREDGEANRVTVRDTGARIDASEAMLRELGLLAEAG